MAPLFHITGLIAHVAVALLVPAELVPFYRFDPEVLVDVLREHRPTFTVAALPVYIALASTPGVTADDLSSMRAAYSGGRYGIAGNSGTRTTKSMFELPHMIWRYRISRA